MAQSQGFPHIAYEHHERSLQESEALGQQFYERMDQRRSVRFFSDRAVPKHLIETAIATASTAPSGAHMQPWTFVAVSSPTLKHQIRLAAEAEERKAYESRMSDEWKAALAPIGTNAEKPYLETCPWLVILFAQLWGQNDEAQRVKHYYVSESCGIAAGLFIASIHQMGLATLTHTPSPMKFLHAILGRPANEKPMILFPVGYPTSDATVPDLKRKPLGQVSVFLE